MMTYHLVRQVFRLLSLLSLANLRRLAELVGSLAWRLKLRPAQTTLRNLALCFPDWPEAQRFELARESLCQTACVALESAALWFWPPERVSALFEEPEGLEEMECAVSKGGVLLALPHLGNWEYLAYALAKGFGITALYQARRLGGYERCMVESRFRFGAKMVNANRGGIRTLFKSLRGGGVVGILPDQVPTRGNGVIAEFMGRNAVTATLFHELLQRTGAQPIVGVCVRVHNGFRMRYVPMAEAVCDPDPVVSCTALNHAIEAEIRRIPSQYQWEYKRFRRVETTDIYRP